ALPGSGDRARTRAFANQANSRVKPATAWERKPKPAPAHAAGADGASAPPRAAPDKPNNSPARSTDSPGPKKGVVTVAVSGEAGVHVRLRVRIPIWHQAVRPATTIPRV